MAQALVSEVHVATHPTRVKIAQELVKGNRLTVTQLQESVGLSEELIAFHLAILENHGLVMPEPDVGNPGNEPRVVTYFRLAPKFRRILREARKLV